MAEPRREQRREPNGEEGRKESWVATLGIWLHSFLEGAVTATSFGVGLLTGILVSVGLILHLIPEVGAVIALLSAAGLSLRQALVRNGVTWALIVVGFLVVYVFLPDMSEVVLAAVLSSGAGGFLYLAYASWRERKWSLGPSMGMAALGIALMGALRLIA
jgi:zinc transporter ZupT